MAAAIPFILMAGGTALGAYSQIQQGKAQSGQFEYEAQKTEREKARMLSRQRALYAKSGVTFEGSPLEVMADTAANYEMDIQNLRQQKKSAKRTSYLNAGSTILTGAGRTFGAWPNSASAISPEESAMSKYRPMW